MPDFDTPAHIKAAAARSLEAGFVRYTASQGVPETRQAIARKLARENAMTVDPESEIVVTCGANEAIGAAVTALVDPGDEVILPDPAWPHYEYLPLHGRGDSGPLHAPRVERLRHGSRRCGAAVVAANAHGRDQLAAQSDRRRDERRRDRRHRAAGARTRRVAAVGRSLRAADLRGRAPEPGALPGVPSRPHHRAACRRPMR